MFIHSNRYTNVSIYTRDSLGSDLKIKFKYEIQCFRRLGPRARVRQVSPESLPRKLK